MKPVYSFTGTWYVGLMETNHDTNTNFQASRTFVRNSSSAHPTTLRFKLERVRYLLKCGIIAASWQRAALKAIEADVIEQIEPKSL